MHRIIGKTICLATRIDATIVCGSDQLCADLSSGIEGFIYVMNPFSTHNDLDSSRGVLMVDASNAFNSLNCTAMLMHAHVLWPRCARYLFNTYRGWSMLIVRDHLNVYLVKKL